MKLRNKKTGEVWDVWSFYDGRQTINLKYSNNDVIALFECHSLSELNEEWEDYKPIEPEIVDETARETIRKWYNKNRIVGKLYSYGGESWLGLRGDDESGCSWKIELHVNYFSKLKSEKLYSLTELCGEEG